MNAYKLIPLLFISFLFCQFNNITINIKYNENDSDYNIKRNIIDRFDASQEIKNISSILGGKGGGGRKDMAQGGGSDFTQINNCLEYIEKKLINLN